MKILCCNMRLVQNTYALQRMKIITNIMCSYHSFQQVIVYLILNQHSIIKKILTPMYHLILQPI
jgi:hypothetical protein